MLFLLFVFLPRSLVAGQASPTKKKLFNFIIQHGTEMWLNRQIGGSGEIPKFSPFIRKYYVMS